MIKTGPYRIHNIPTDNGVQFVQRDQGGVQGCIGHIFGRVCKQNGIERRLIKPYHPWTNG
jgi:transposase InsO family protein